MFTAATTMTRSEGLDAPAAPGVTHEVRATSDSAKSACTEQIVVRVREICKGCSATRVGQLTSTHPETARRYLAGDTAPSAAFLAAVCGAFGVCGHWLLTGEGASRAADAQTEPQVVQRHAQVVRTALQEIEVQVASLRAKLDAGAE